MVVLLNCALNCFTLYPMYRLTLELIYSMLSLPLLPLIYMLVVNRHTQNNLTLARKKSFDL